MELNGLVAAVGFLGTLFGLAISFFNFNRNRDKDVRASASDQAVINTKLDGISNGVDSVRIDLKSLQAEQNKIMQQVARNDEKIDSAHKRIDKLEGRLNEN